MQSKGLRLKTRHQIFFFGTISSILTELAASIKKVPSLSHCVEDITVIVLNLVLLVFRPMRKQVFSQTFACTHDIYHMEVRYACVPRHSILKAVVTYLNESVN